MRRSLLLIGVAASALITCFAAAAPASAAMSGFTSSLTGSSWDGYQYVSATSVTFSWVGSGSEARYSLDGAGWIAAPITGSASFTGLNEGNHTFILDFHDVNWGNGGAGINWRVDLTPPSPFALTNLTNGATTSAAPTFEWGQAVDNFSSWGFPNVENYKVFVDGVNVAVKYGPVASSHLCPTNCSYSFPTPSLADGDHTVYVVATDLAGNSTETAHVGFVVHEAPTAQLVVQPSLAVTGESVLLNASGSSVANSGALQYAWDLDGDGNYETSGGASTSRSWSTAGIKTVGVRVTAPGGMTDEAATSVEVRKAPPQGEPGFSINDGSPFTNSKNVELNLVWPKYATLSRVSNDGGFAGSKTQQRELADVVSWVLDDSVKGIYTKNVYLRFSGSGLDESKTFSDDIILDTGPPTITSADISASSGSPKLTLASAAKSKTYLVKLKARDDRSGVAKVQVSSKKSPQKAKTTAFTTRLKLASKSKSIWIRVRDGAGNYSKWRKLR